MFNTCPVAKLSVGASKVPEAVVNVTLADGLFLLIFVIRSFAFVPFVTFLM